MVDVAVEGVDMMSERGKLSVEAVALSRMNCRENKSGHQRGSFVIAHPLSIFPDSQAYRVLKWMFSDELVSQSNRYHADMQWSSKFEEVTILSPYPGGHVMDIATALRLDSESSASIFCSFLVNLGLMFRV